MDVEYLLERGGTIGEEQVDALTGQVGSAKGAGDAMGDPEHGGTDLGVELLQVGDVPAGNDEDLSRRHRA